MSIPKVALRAVVFATGVAVAMKAKNTISDRSQDGTQHPLGNANGPKRPLGSRPAPRQAEGPQSLRKTIFSKAVAEDRIEADKYFVESPQGLIFTGNPNEASIVPIRRQIVEEVLAQCAPLSPDAQIRRLAPMAENFGNDYSVDMSNQEILDCFQTLALRMQAWPVAEQAKGLKVLTDISCRGGDDWDKHRGQLLQQIMQWRNPQLQGPALVRMAHTIADLSYKGPAQAKPEVWSRHFDAIFKTARDWEPTAQAPAMESLARMLSRGLSIDMSEGAAAESSGSVKALMVFSTRGGSAMFTRPPSNMRQGDFMKVTLLSEQRTEPGHTRKSVPLDMLVDKHDRLASHVEGWAPDIKAPVLAALGPAHRLLAESPRGVASH